MEVLKLTCKNVAEIVDRVLPILKRGGVVVIPTDTVYGLAADARNPQAVKKIFAIKQRPEQKKLPVFIGSIKEAEKLAEIDKRQRKFLKKVWPGKVTAVLKLKIPLPDALTRDGTAGIRIPRHDFVLGLLKALGGLLAQSSVNVSGKPGHAKISELLAEFESAKIQPDIVIDAGDLPESEPSTIVDLTGDDIKILREGAVSKEKLLSYIEWYERP